MQKSQVWERSKFDVPMRIRPDKDDIEKAARMLIEAKNPLISVGDEITWCRGEKELVELAELLGAPVAGETGGLGYWSKPFPTRHPLFIGTVLRTMRYPGKPDVLLNLGNRLGELASPGTKLISIRLDPTSLARSAPVDLAMVADLRLAIADLTAAIRSMATASRLASIADERAARSRAYSAQMADARLAIANGLADSSPISMERLGHRARSQSRPRHLLRRRRRLRKDHGSADERSAATTSNISAPARTCWAGAWRRGSASNWRGPTCRWSPSSATAASCSRARSHCGAWRDTRRR